MTIEELNTICKNSFVDHLGIWFTDFNEEEIKGYIDIKDFHLQPQSVVHGGVYISFAETLAGAGSSLLLDDASKIALGSTVNSQHLASVKEGRIFGKGELIYNSTFKHIWDIDISDQSGKLISICRVTNSIREIKPNKD